MRNPNFNYIQKILRTLQTIMQSSASKTEEVRYRLVKLPSEADPYIHIQIINTRAISKLLPEKIMHDNMLLHFSKSDIALIAHLGTKNEVQKIAVKEKFSFYKIVKRLFNKDNTTSYLLEKEDNQMAEHSAEEIYRDEVLAEKLTGKDGMIVGYSVAEAHYQKVLKLKIK